MPPHVFMCFRGQGLQGFSVGFTAYSCSQAGKIIPVKDQIDSFKLQQIWTTLSWPLSWSQLSFFENGEKLN